jgi:hypothetical protein
VAASIGIRAKEINMGSVRSAHLFINGSDDEHLTIPNPASDPSLPVTVTTQILTNVTLTDEDIARIGEDTYYDVRVRLWERDRFDEDERMWQVRRRIDGVPSQTVEVTQSVFIHELRSAGTEYYGTIRVDRRTAGAVDSASDGRETNTINLRFS